MQAIIGALVSATGFGAANIVIKKSLEEVPVAKTLFMSFFSGFVVLLIYLVLTNGLKILSGEQLLIAAGLSLIEIILYITLYIALIRSNVTVAAALIGLYPILISLGSTIFLGAEIVPTDWIFIVIMISAALLVSIDTRGVVRDGLDKKDLVEGFWWMVLAMIAHSIYFPALGAFTESGDLLPKLLHIKFFTSIFFFAGAYLLSRTAPIAENRKLPALSLLGLFEMIGWIGFSWAVSADLNQVGIVSAATNASAVVTGILAYIFLKERLKLLQYFGITIIVFALMAQAFLS